MHELARYQGAYNNNTEGLGARLPTEDEWINKESNKTTILIQWAIGKPKITTKGVTNSNKTHNDRNE